MDVYSEERGDGQGELAPPLLDPQLVLPSSHDDEMLPHGHDTTSPSLSPSTEIEEDEADLADSASSRESTPPAEHAPLLNQQISDVHSKLHSGEHQFSSSAKELTNPDAVVNNQGYPHLTTLSGPDEAVNEPGYPRIFSTRGQAPRSTIEGILYGSEEPHPREVASTRGHAPPSTIQHLLYPLRQAPPTNLNDSGSLDNRATTDDDSAELVELGPSSKFTDQYDLLGRSSM